MGGDDAERPVIPGEGRGRYLGAVVQIVYDSAHAEHPELPWAAMPLYENNLELALTWLRSNYMTLIEALDAEA